MTAIEWTDKTWNPVTGCSKVSAGCDHCYAETLSLRFGWSKKPWTPENAAENVRLRPERLEQPLKWRNPSRVFVNSMSDLFHELIPDDYIHSVFQVMERAEQHTFQVLTKRPDRAAAVLRWLYTCSWCNGDGCGLCDEHDAPQGMKEPLQNVWIGTSIESWRFNHRADQLRRAPAAVRFVSAEPLLDTLYGKRPLDLTGIDWVIVGGESGFGFRPMRAEWAKQIRDHCRREDVAFFFKQWGGRTPKSGGRELDGRTWDEYP